ncbi:MAG: Hpt domain-containing protein [Desulfurivibrionaceae bacterium]
MTGKFSDSAPFPRRGKEDLAAPLDFERCVNIFGGDRGAALKLLHDFVKNFESRLKLLADALAVADCEAVRKEAHSIKGAAAVLAATPLKSAAELLEEAAKSGDLVKGAKGLRAIEREIALLATFCGKLQK